MESFLTFKKHLILLNNDIVFVKLEHWGIRGIPLKLFKTYLTERTQYTARNNDISETLSINVGEPQGSVIGLLVFLINQQLAQHRNIL